MPVSDKRVQIPKSAVEDVIKGLRVELDRRTKEKGAGAFLSTHEVLGVVSEEFHELEHAVRSNRLKDVHNELVDIAVACIFGVACIQEERMDW